MAVFLFSLAVGSLASASLIFLLASVVPDLPPVPGLILLGAVGGLLLARDLGLVSFRLPESTWLIPRRVFEESFVVGGAVFGAVLGAAIFTKLPAGSPYYLALSAVTLLERPGHALAVALGFAMGRGAVPLGRFVANELGPWDGVFLELPRALVPVATALCLIVVLAVVGRA